MIMAGSWWRTTYSSCLRLALLSGLATQAATLPAQDAKQMAGMFPAASENGFPPSCGAGHFRWNVKILEDADRFQVQFKPLPATIKELNAIPKPAQPYPANSRIRPWELQVYQVRARLKAVLPEQDGDLHLFLEDPDHPEEHMIAEIPAPECVHDAVRAEEYRLAREAARASKLNGVVEVTGVGFFDKMGSLSVVKARNGMELHPAFRIRILHGVGNQIRPTK